MQKVAPGIDVDHRIHPGWRSASGCDSVDYLWTFRQPADWFFPSYTLFCPGFSFFQSSALEHPEADGADGSNHGLLVVAVVVRLGGMETVPLMGPSCGLEYPGELELHKESCVCIPWTLNELDDRLRTHIHGM